MLIRTLFVVTPAIIVFMVLYVLTGSAFAGFIFFTGISWLGLEATKYRPERGEGRN